MINRQAILSFHRHEGHGGLGAAFFPRNFFPFGAGALLCLSLFSGCNRSANQLPVMPPATFPLTRDYIGYGVVNVSFTHFFNEPGSGGISRGYLRRGTVARIIERRQALIRGRAESWVFVEGNYQGSASLSQGWIQEADIDVYENESRAITASRALTQ